jgi:hypothetical protein
VTLPSQQKPNRTDIVPFDEESPNISSVFHFSVVISDRNRGYATHAPWNNELRLGEESGWTPGRIGTHYLELANLLANSHRNH